MFVCTMFFYVLFIHMKKAFNRTFVTDKVVRCAYDGHPRDKKRKTLSKVFT